jgi:hypothetical protein
LPLVGETVLRPATFERTDVVSRWEVEKLDERCDAAVTSICVRATGRHEIAVNPIFTRNPIRVSRNTMADGDLDVDTSYQLVHDELMLDVNARLSLATFVTTWMERQARTLMSECFDKNMIVPEGVDPFRCQFT